MKTLSLGALWNRCQPVGKGGAIALGAALAAAVFASGWLPETAYKTQAEVLVEDAGVSLNGALAQAAAGAAVSKPVIARAASSLVETSLPVPEPGLVERLGVAVGLEGATDRASRLGTDLERIVYAVPGQVPGTILVGADAETPENAARIANAVAEALVVEQDAASASLRQQRDLTEARRLDALKARALKAHQRLVALGGSDVDPVQARAAAAAQTAAAQSRLDAIRAIIASGSPPLSDRRDVPQTIETLQAAYFDQTNQLAKARETLGDRHTTVISLQDGVRRAAQNLTGEWKRLARLAEADLGAARDREAVLRKPEMPADAARRASLETARRDVQIADAAVAQSQGRDRDDAGDEKSYRLLALAPIPTRTVGWSLIVRLAVSAALGLGLASLLVAASRRPAKEITNAEPSQEITPAAPSRRRMAAASTFFDEEPDLDDHDPFISQGDTSVAPNRSGMKMGPVASAGLVQAMWDLLPGLDEIEPQFGPVPTVLVAANEATLETTPIAVALGRAAADAGLRTLLIEAGASQRELAAEADPDGDPIVADIFGALRVAMPARGAGELLFVAPVFANGARLASALAKGGDVPVVDELDRHFDLIVIDCGRVIDCAAEGWAADAYLRVGRFASQRDDERFLAAAGASPEALAGTFTGDGLIRPAEPVQAESFQAEPAQASLAQASLARAKLVQTKPAQTKPVQTKPVLTKPAPDNRVAPRAMDAERSTLRRKPVARVTETRRRRVGMR